MIVLRRILALFAMLAVLAGCGVPREARAPVTEADVARLTAEILALGPGIDPEEAARAAALAYSYPKVLAARYEITDPPLIHNMKVNAGLRPRGLCWHWAEDMETRLDAEGFETLQMHRAIANSDSAILIDHSTAIVSRKGDDMFAGVVLDPWRWGGALFWAPVLEDADYEWRPQREVLDKRRRIREDKAQRGIAPI